MPVYVHVIDHPDARVLVDTGMTELHPAMADIDPRLRPLTSRTSISPASTRRQHTPARRPLRRQPPLRRQADLRPARGLDDARSEDDYTIREWSRPGVRYVPVDGELEPRAPTRPGAGPTPGMQMVVVGTGGRPVIVGGDVAVWLGEFDEPPTEGRQRSASTPSSSGSRTSTSHGDPRRLRHHDPGRCLSRSR